MGMLTLLDIVKANGADAMVGLIDETTKAHPELALLPSRTIKGLNFKTLVRVALGSTAASFRSANAGVAPIKNTYENRLVETFILDARLESDKAVADRSEDGPQAYLAMEGGGVMEGQIQGVCGQFYYGTDATFGNASGFPGLLQSYDTANMEVDATGTTDNIASSVWLCRYGPSELTWVWGANGAGLTMPAIREETILDPNDSTKKLTAYVGNILAYPGLQVGSLRSVCRIKKITEDNGKGLTDALLNKALEKFQPGFGPNIIFMSQRSARQLQSSRTATNPTGQPAPWPNSIVGVDGQTIPIHVTAAISNIETLAL